MRLFTAIEIPETLGQKLALLKGSLFPARWIAPDNYHITLRFMGDIPEYLARDLDAMLADTLATPFAITVEQLDVFGKDHPRAIIARVGLSDQLKALQQEQERICRKLGLPPETRKFVPHITLARLKDVSPFDTADWLAHKGIFHRQTFTVTEFALFSSHHSTGGGPYYAEARYPLRNNHLMPL